MNNLMTTKFKFHSIYACPFSELCTADGKLKLNRVDLGIM